MQSIIHIDKLQKGRAVASTCVHFGFCTAVCPTYVLDGEENDSPRGRIALIKDMLESGATPDATTMKHVDRCLSCLSCTTTCAAGVDYRSLVDTAREYIEASGARPLSERVQRKALAYTMTTPWLLRLLNRIGTPGLRRLGARFSAQLGALDRLAGAPALRALAPRRIQIDQGPEQAKSPTRRVALLDGCAQSVLGPEINDATRRVLRRLGVEVVESKSDIDGACCGALNLHLGYEKKASGQAAVLVEYWNELLERGTIDAIVVTTSGCGSVIRHYHELFEHDPVRKEKARRVKDACIDISELLASFEMLPSKHHRGVRVAYHDSCSLKHGQGLTREPRKVLKDLGYTLTDIAESHLCCGSAGTYNILQPDIASRLGQRKADNIVATKPHVAVAGNMGCLLQISMYMEVPVVHVIQLVDWALGGPAPIGLEDLDLETLPSSAPATGDIWHVNTAPVAQNTDSLW